MTRILGITGSLRAASYNTALLKTAQGLAPAGCTIELATLHGIPLYDGDLEDREGLPAAARRLREQIVAADGVLLASPEYNGGVPGVLKNALDWVSRPQPGEPSPFAGKPFAVIGASISGFGSVLAQVHWLPVFRQLGVRYWCGAKVTVSSATKAFGSDGTLTDEAAKKSLADFVAAYAKSLG